MLRRHEYSYRYSPSPWLTSTFTVLLYPFQTMREHDVCLLVMTWFQNMNSNHIVYFMIMIQFTRRCWLETWYHPAVINILFPQERATIVVDFGSAISELSIISKGSTLCHVIVEADSILYGRHGTTSVSQSWGLLSSTRQSYLHVLKARYAASR